MAGGLAKDPDDRPETCGDLLAAAGAELLPQLGMFARVGRRGLVGLALLASLIAAAAVVPAMLLTGSGTGLAGAVPTTEPDVDVVQRIDPTTNELSATIPTGVTERGAAIGEGRGIAAAAGAVWMTNLVDQTVVRIDSQTNAAVVIGIRGPPSDLAVGPDEVWVTSFSAGEGRLTEVNATTSRVRRAVSLGSFEPIAVALGKTSVWIAAQDVGRGVLLRLDRQTLELVAEIPFPGRPSDLVVTGTDVWAISTPLTQVEKGVFRIDTSTNELVETIELPNAWCAPVARQQPSGSSVPRRLQRFTFKTVALTRMAAASRGGCLASSIGVHGNPSRHRDRSQAALAKRQGRGCSVLPACYREGSRKSSRRLYRV